MPSPSRLLLVAALLASTSALAAEPALLAGDKLVLQTGRTDAAQLVSTDASIGLGLLNGSADDPPIFAPGFLGTHLLDYNFAMGDLLRLVVTKAAAMPGA